MERLTQRIDYNYEYEYGSIGIACDDEQYLEKVYNKLGRLEDLEQELGIDLITLFKALKEGIYIKEYKQIKHLKTVILFYDIIAKQYRIKGYDNGQDYTLSNYRKTWSLRKEDLEDEKEN